MKKIFIGNLPADTIDHDLVALFETYGKVRSIKLITDMFTKKCKGFGFIEMEGHEARAAIQKLNNSNFNGNVIRVSFESQKPKTQKRY